MAFKTCWGSLYVITPNAPGGHEWYICEIKTNGGCGGRRLNKCYVEEIDKIMEQYAHTQPYLELEHTRVRSKVCVIKRNGRYYLRNE